MINILAISGSLRRVSINTKLLRAIARVPHAGVTVSFCPDIGALPLFNPDLEGSEPQSVFDFRAAVAEADGIIIASPEYAHGITGVLKNALDWVVGSSEFVGKHVAVLNAAPRSAVANEALKEVLRTIDARIVVEASLDIPVLGKDLDVDGLLQDPELSPLIERTVAALASAIRKDSEHREAVGQ